MMAKTNFNETMPLYNQYGGACGLASLLMSLNPKKRGVSCFLDEIAKKYSQITEYSTNEKKYQQVIEFLLLKSIKSNKIQNILKNTIGKRYENVILPILQFENNYILNSEIDHNYLMKRVNVWKQDIELQVIFAMFGIQYIPYRSEDGTGAVYFDSKDKDKKYSFLIDNLKNDNPTLCCFGCHWNAIKSIKEYNILCYDPMGSKHRRKISDLHKNSRFYCFTYNHNQKNTNIEKLKHILL